MSNLLKEEQNKGGSMNRLTRIALVFALGLTACTGFAASARADHHQIMVREVHRGATSAGDYVMLQLFADGQNVALDTHAIDMLDSDGTPTEYELPDVPNGQTQRTILIGNTGVAGADLNAAGIVVQQNGAVCYDENLNYDGTNGIDCAAWGAFSGFTYSLSSPAQPIALDGTGLAAGQTLVRTVARGCPTALDAADDTNSTAADFALGSPIGRNNAANPTETLCGENPIANPNPDPNLTPPSPAAPATSTRKKCKKRHRSAKQARKRCRKK
jgi:hypothetical protein